MVAALALVAMALVAACAIAPAGSAAPKTARPAGPAVTATAPAPRLYLHWAGMEYSIAGTADPVVKLRIVLDNHMEAHTESTSIKWEPSFAQQFTFLRSNPAPWRVRIDEQGWGVLDTSGVLPMQFGTFELWFFANAPVVQEPRIVIVANGGTLIADTTARAVHLEQQRPSTAQLTFEQGPIAAVGETAERLRLVPSDARGVFRVAAALAVLLTVIAIGGGVAAYWSTAGRATASTRANSRAPTPSVAEP